MKWEIIKGSSFKRFEKSYKKNLKKKKINEEKIDRDFERMYTENSSLLSKCINPSKDSSEITNSTGIAMGLIQSGKTGSMEMLSHLARDNGYKIVIILSGLVGSLTEQTKERIFSSTNGINWRRIFIPEGGKTLDYANNINQMIKAFDTWEQDIFNEKEKQSIIIISMKNIPRLKKLIKLLKKFDENDPRLSKAPCLILDDECDHASLNNFPKERDNEDDMIELSESEFATLNEDYTVDEFLEINGVDLNELLALNNLKSYEELSFGKQYRIAQPESATHSRIKLLRKILNNSSYVGYTATPYANLLINTWTNLSPKFAEILSPGEDYLGSKFFFRENKNYLRTILPDDAIGLESSGTFPDSLDLAIKIFILGVAVGILNKDHENLDARTMFIHTASQVSEQTGGFLSHEFVKEEVDKRIEELKKIFKKVREQNNGNIDISNSFKSEFNEAINDLNKTLTNKITLDKLFLISIEKALYFIEIISFNAGENRKSIPKINWYEEDYARILIGGTGLDRGYTVEGLTVSYLLRSSSAQLDTTLQRARFFGYQKRNLEYFRIFLPKPSQNYFTDGSLTEHHLRDHLKDFLKGSNSNQLQQWPRFFIGSSQSNFELTNPRRIEYELIRNRRFYETIKDKEMHMISEEGILLNQKLWNELNDKAETIQNINNRTYILKHKWIPSSLDFIKSIFLQGQRFSPKGSFAFGFLAQFIEEMNFTGDCPIILMSDTDDRNGRKKFRSHKYETGKITHLQSNGDGSDFQRENLVFYEYLNDPTYPNKPQATYTPTLQIYNFDIKFDDEIKMNNIPFFHFYSPSEWFKKITPIFGQQN